MVFWEGDHQRIEPVGVWEGRTQAQGWWRSIGGRSASTAGIDCTRPWSAAFISWVMAEGGRAGGCVPAQRCMPTIFAPSSMRPRSPMHGCPMT